MIYETKYNEFGQVINKDGTPTTESLEGRLPELANETVSQNIVSGGRSKNYVPGERGWQLTEDGDLEANSGIFRGTLTGNTINGATITGGLIQTALTGFRVVLDGSDGKLKFYNNNSLLCSMFGDGSYDLNLSATANVNIQCGGSQTVFFDSTGIFPNIDGTMNLGNSTYTFAQVHAEKYKTSGLTGQSGDFYVATSSGGSPTNKLTFTNGILTAT